MPSMPFDVTVPRAAWAPVPANAASAPLQPSQGASVTPAAASLASGATRGKAKGRAVVKPLTPPCIAAALLQDALCPARLRVGAVSCAGAWTAVPTAALHPRALSAVCDLLTARPASQGAPRGAYAAPKSWPMHVLQAHAGLLWVPTPFAQALWGPPGKAAVVPGAPMRCGECTASLWSHPVPQQQAVSHVLAQLRARRAACGVGAVRLIMPCGAGKTIVAAALARALGKCTLIVVHRVFLLQQWVARLLQVLPGVRIAVYSGAASGQAAVRRALEASAAAAGGCAHVHVAVHPWDAALHCADVVLATVDTVVSRSPHPSTWRRVGLLLLDEAHHVSAQSFTALTRVVPAAYRLCLTATPRRKDGLLRELAWLSGPIVFRAYRKGAAVPVHIVHTVGTTAQRVMRPAPRGHKRSRSSAGRSAAAAAADGEEDMVLDVAATTLALANDAPRNALIAALVLRLTRLGHDVLVAVRRVEHMGTMMAALHAAAPDGVPAAQCHCDAPQSAAPDSAQDASVGAALALDVRSVHSEGEQGTQASARPSLLQPCAGVLGASRVAATTKRAAKAVHASHAACAAAGAGLWKAWHAVQCCAPCPVQVCETACLRAACCVCSPADVLRGSPDVTLVPAAAELTHALAEVAAALQSADVLATQAQDATLALDEHDASAHASSALDAPTPRTTAAERRAATAAAHSTEVHRAATSALDLSAALREDCAVCVQAWLHAWTPERPGGAPTPAEQSRGHGRAQGAARSSATLQRPSQLHLHAGHPGHLQDALRNALQSMRAQECAMSERHGCPSAVSTTLERNACGDWRAHCVEAWWSAVLRVVVPQDNGVVHAAGAAREPACPAALQQGHPWLACVHGGTPAAQRSSAFHARVLLATEQLLGEGFDAPHFSALVMADEHSDVEQLVGRILRPAPPAACPAAQRPAPVVVDVPREHSSPLKCAARKREYTAMRMVVREQQCELPTPESAVDVDVPVPLHPASNGSAPMALPVVPNERENPWSGCTSAAEAAHVPDDAAVTAARDAFEQVGVLCARASAMVLPRALCFANPHTS